MKSARREGMPWWRILFPAGCFVLFSDCRAAECREALRSAVGPFVLDLRSAHPSPCYPMIPPPRRRGRRGSERVYYTAKKRRTRRTGLIKNTLRPRRLGGEDERRLGTPRRREEREEQDLYK